MAHPTSKRRRPSKPQRPPIKPLGKDQVASPNVSELQQTLIGKFVVLWAKLEASLNDMIWVITGLGLENGRILTERNDATRQITILLALVERNIAEDKHPNGNKEKLLRTLDQIDILRENRNAIIHGSWGEIDGVPVTASLRFKSSNLSEVVCEAYPPQMMTDICDAVERHIKNLGYFIKAIEASRKTSPPPPS